MKKTKTTAKAKTKKKPTAKTKTKPKVTKSKVKPTKKKAEKTHILAIIDKSGSMSTIAQEAMGGFNKFLAEQKKLKDKATMNVVLFSSASQITSLYNGEILDVKDVQELTPLNYQPGGSTALNDAIVQSMTKYQLKINEMKPSQKPDKVLVIIVTDGEENASIEYPKSKVDEVKKLITKRKSENWTFMFLCATEDAALTGEALGVSKGNVYQYTNDIVGNAVMFSSMSLATASLRSTSVNSKDYQALSDNLLSDEVINNANSKVTTTDDDDLTA